MQQLLILGAGRSASSLIKYWCDNAAQYQVFITVADPQIELALSKINSCTLAKAVSFNVENTEETKSLIQSADLVISMLPAFLHIQVAKICLEENKNLLTASYASDEIKSLHQEALSKGLLIMMECGLDPGIDHMSAMKIVHHLKGLGAEITSFKSYCGGLVAPESDTNPWHYKFSWNPRNVILAGQGTARYLDNGSIKYIPYQHLFQRTEKFEIDGKQWDGYANRDSLSYIDLYELHTCKTFVRGTLRGEDYCLAWAQLVKLGLTDDSFTLNISNGMTWKELVLSFLPANINKQNIEKGLAEYLGLQVGSKIFQMLIWLDILSDRPLVLNNASPAQHLQQLLEEKWQLESEDKDMILMVHEFEYQLDGVKKRLISSLIAIGDDQTYTAMAKTVGLPLAIVAKMILKNEIEKRGVVLPISKDIYLPVLKELEGLGIVFEERVV